MLLTLYKTELTAWKRRYVRLLTPLLLSLKHLSWHVTKFQIWINIWQITFFQCIRTEPHSSILRNVENSTSNFRRSVQICRREEQREENNGNCKGFFVIHKRNNRVNGMTITDYAHGHKIGKKIDEFLSRTMLN